MNVGKLKKKADKAWTRRQYYDHLLRDVYDYVMPMRDVTGLHVAGGGQTEAAKRTDKVFDATAIKAAFRFAGRIQTELTPIFQEFFALEAGPLLPGDDNKKALTEELAKVSAMATAVLSAGDYHNSSHEMYVDLYGGQGHMLILEGDEDNLARFLVVPVPEVAIELGPYGDIWHWYWKRRYPVEDLETLWPNGKFCEALRNLMKAADPGEVEVCQYTYYDAKEKNYKLLVWTDKCEDAADPLHSETSRTSPWVSPRFFKVPGEPYGRGPAMLAMPFIKTANMTRELQLKAAAIALMGVWAYKNDGVFNPDTVKFEPLSMWAVSSTGGAMGATLQRLPVPQDFDISGITMAEEREQMKLALLDDTLPPDGAAVRSATEIAERISKLNQDMSGAYGRLVLEIVVPVVRRTIDILEKKGKLQTSLKIDQLLTRVRVIAPLAAAQMANKVRAFVQWGEMIGVLGGPGEFAKVARTEKAFADLGRWLGNEEALIRSDAERQKLDQADREAAQAQQAAELAKAMPDGPSPAGQLIDGGMV